MTKRFFPLSVLFLAAQVCAQPIIDSWFTRDSGRYARIFPTRADELAGNAVTTWNRGDGVQEWPVYAGIHEITATADWVYLRTTGLASYTMGPWYTDVAQQNLVGNYPGNLADIYRFPRVPVDPSTVINKQLTGGGPIGYFVNGVAIFDSRDAWSYIEASGMEGQGNTGDGAWNRDAYVNEGPAFDASNAHQAGARYHHHASPTGLRYQLGDSVSYNASSNLYSETFNGEHSPILGWLEDGLPIYGPYGYQNATNPASPVVRMRTGFQRRTDIQAPGSPRDHWPDWATRVYAGKQAFSNGPPVSVTYPLGRYMEDNDYKGDLGMTLGVDFDLNEYNVRYCVTPDFPQGTWAYFVCIDPNGTPTFPYNISRAFWGDPTGGDAGLIPAEDDTNSVPVTLFTGGPVQPPRVHNVAVDATDKIALTWSAAEGGSYQILEAPGISPSNVWQVIATTGTLTNNVYTTTPLITNPSQAVFALGGAETLMPFDRRGFQATGLAPPPTTGNGRISSILSGGPNDLSELPLTLTFNGVAVNVPTANIVRRSRRAIEFDFDVSALPFGDYPIEAQFAQGALRTAIYRVRPNILVMILDDWGADNSPLDNPLADARLPAMPNYETLASQGVRFARGFAQPICSPTRATMMTGRHPFQHQVGNADLSGNFSNGQDELTLPEIFTLMDMPHGMFSVGKWHLGGSNNAYASLGGWQEFFGIQNGGVQSYTQWDLNRNGDSVTSTVYSTSHQVDHAINMIGQNIQRSTPWFAWVAFNAPHSPFEAPPAHLAPAGGYSPQENGETNNEYNYRLSLEALDTELGRLLEVVDLTRTAVFVIGDNGSPGQAVQAPYGNGRNKGSLYQGGIHVPFLVAGLPVSTPGTTSSNLVHCIDLFSTILELVDIDETIVPGLSNQNVHSTSLLPLLDGTDTASRCVVAERFGEGTAGGRTIIVDSHPDYKLIIRGDPNLTIDDPSFELYHIGSDTNELNPLDIGSLTGTALAAYNACLAKDAALGGGYSDPAGPHDVLYLELSTADPIPNLTANNGNSIDIQSATVNGQLAHVIGRLSAGPILNDQTDDIAAQYWAKVRMPISPPYTTATVTISGISYSVIQIISL